MFGLELGQYTYPEIGSNRFKLTSLVTEMIIKYLIRSRGFDIKMFEYWPNHNFRLQWRNKDMLEAMKAVEEKKMTIRGAAKKFAVPYSTLKDRVHGRVRHGTKPGVKTALSPEEEEELVRYVKVSLCTTRF